MTTLCAAAAGQGGGDEGEEVSEGTDGTDGGATGSSDSLLAWCASPESMAYCPAARTARTTML